MLDWMDRALARARSEEEVWIGGGASARAIAMLESGIGHPLPPDFRAYLERFGSVCVGDQTLTGILDDDPMAPDVANTVGATLQLREWAPDLPSDFWVLMPHEDGGYCFDFARADAPVCNFEPHRLEHRKPIARGFEAFVRDWVLADWA